MTLVAIEITNVKGIDHRRFKLDIHPNFASILFAPNGFGKSSFATAFKSLNQQRLKLADDDYYKHDNANDPSLKIDHRITGNPLTSYVADKNKNEIKDVFDVVVINNLVKAKGTRLRFGGATAVSASLHIEPIILVDKVPDNVSFGYMVTQVRQAFGNNGSVLPNLASFLDKPPFLSALKDNFGVLNRFQGKMAQQRLNTFKAAINGSGLNRAALLAWIEGHLLADLQLAGPVKEMADILEALALGITKLQAYLIAYQLGELYQQDKGKFKQACDRGLYEISKKGYLAAYEAFNATWKDIKPKEREAQLIVEFPNANYISNGQRDILCFIGLLEQARQELQKDDCILVIDEIFDYLDEANLVTAQYYISEFIADFRNRHKRIYPLILTHLNPVFFRSYALSKQKTYPLDVRNHTVIPHLQQLLQHRENPGIKDDTAKYLLHYHTGQINRRADYMALGLFGDWGELNHFDTYIEGEAAKYLAKQAYDPFAVCCALRKKVEKVAYDKIPSVADKQTFLTTFKTADKLLFAEAVGVEVPEYHYLLGIIYNDAMHWTPGVDKVSPVVVKLENLTIRNLINKVYA